MQRILKCVLLMLVSSTALAQNSWRVELGFSPDVCVYTDTKGKFTPANFRFPHPDFGFRLSILGTKVFRNNFMVKFGIQARRFGTQSTGVDMDLGYDTTKGIDPAILAKEELKSNHYWLEVPIYLGYSKKWGSWELQPHVGIALGLYIVEEFYAKYTYRNGRTSQTHDQSLRINYPALAANYTPVQLFALIGLGINYHLRNSLFVGIEPGFQMNIYPSNTIPKAPITSIRGNNSFSSFVYTNVGVKLTIGYTFGK